MGSLFFRTYLSVIAFAVIAFILTVFVIFKPFILREEWSDFQAEVEVDYQLLMLKLDSAAHSRWANIIDNHQPVFDFDLVLLAPSDVDAEQRTILEQPDPRQVLSKFEDDVWYALYRIPGSDKILRLQETEGMFTDLDALDKFWLLLPLALISLAQLFAVLLLVRKITKPIQGLADVAAHFGEGNFAARADTNAPNPIKRLSASFNAMAGRIEQTIDEQKTMIAAIPHELRTPLSRLRFILELSRSNQTEDELRESLSEVDENIEELERAVDEILELLRIQERRILKRKAVDLDALVVPVLDQHKDQPELTLTLENPAKITVFAHTGMLRRALRNLLQNACKYARSNIGVNAFVDNGQVVIQVDDDGPGIPPDKRREVLALFARLDQSRSRSTGGFGLGLALVKMIMLQHQGDIGISDSPLGGARLELRWPNVPIL